MKTTIRFDVKEIEILIKNELVTIGQDAHKAKIEFVNNEGKLSHVVVVIESKL